jgi:hypothetical protein
VQSRCTRENINFVKHLRSTSSGDFYITLHISFQSVICQQHIEVYNVDYDCEVPYLWRCKILPLSAQFTNDATPNTMNSRLSYSIRHVLTVQILFWSADRTIHDKVDDAWYEAYIVLVFSLTQSIQLVFVSILLCRHLSHCTFPLQHFGALFSVQIHHLVSIPAGCFNHVQPSNFTHQPRIVTMTHYTRSSPTSSTYTL